MLPRLSNVPQLNNVVSDYLSELQKQHFEGDIASNYADRLSLATDNSVYQQLPQAILFPKSVADVVRITKLANKEKYLHLTFTPRGGGTGTNGQSINNNIIVDLSRHMTGILELNIEERWVRVQAGVVKDQLNQFLKPHGLFFAPELSTSNRATLGGMINTDASGQGSLQYGKTSDHVLALRSVLMNGEILDTSAVKSDDVLENYPLAENGKTLHQTIFQRCKEKRASIIQDLPQLNRFLTGYDLKNVFNNDESEFNLTRILTGSEGSLAFICEAKLNLLPIPKYRTLINVKYSSSDLTLQAMLEQGVSRWLFHIVSLGYGRNSRLRDNDSDLYLVIFCPMIRRKYLLTWFGFVLHDQIHPPYHSSRLFLLSRFVQIAQKYAAILWDCLA